MKRRGRNDPGVANIEISASGVARADHEMRRIDIRDRSVAVEVGEVKGIFEEDMGARGANRAVAFGDQLVWLDRAIARA